MSIAKELWTPETKWRTYEGRTPAGAKIRWRARQKVRGWDGIQRDWQAYDLTRDAAERALNKKVADFLAPRTEKVSADMSVGALADMWIKEKTFQRDNGELAANSYRTYIRTWHQHLAPRFATVRVDKLGKKMVRDGLMDISTNVGISAAKSARSVMVGVMGLAFDEDVIPRNPAASISLPNAEKRVVDSLSPDEVKILRAFISDEKRGVKPDTRMLIEIQLGTGARVGEACALTWDSIDFERGRVYISRTVIRVDDTGLRLDKVKTPTSERILRAPQRTMRLLQEHRAQWREEGDPMVLRAPMGGLADPSNMQYSCRLIMRALAAETGSERWLHVTTHTLRRTAATLLLAAGVPIHEVSSHLGHADIATTLSHYVGRTTSGSDRADEILGGEDE